MLAPLHPVRDLRLSGQVIYTGHSSMEVAVKMEAIERDGKEETIMLGAEHSLPWHLSISFATGVCSDQMFCTRSILHGLQRCKYLSREEGEPSYHIYT